MPEEQKKTPVPEPPEDGVGEIPSRMPVLPLRDATAFPEMVVPLVVGRQKSITAVDAALLQDKVIALVTQKLPETEDPKPSDLRAMGTAGAILKMFKFPDNSTRILVQGVTRIKVKEIVQTDPYIMAEVEAVEDILNETKEFSALVKQVGEQFQHLLSSLPNVPEEVKITAMNISEAGKLADFIAANINLDTDDRQKVLATVDITERLRLLLDFLNKEIEVAELGNEIQSRVRERMEKGQREYYLREQLKAIQQELGEEDGKSIEIEELRQKIEERGLSEEAKKEAEKELTRLERMSPMSAEFSVILSYLDWLTGLPWQEETEDLLDVVQVRKVLDRDHWGLDKIKDRIVEYVAVRKLNPDRKGPILCFVGPPGVGKTSLGHSIAESMGRRFSRMSLGGVRDEAEIRGHRRTYVGALPGKIVQAISRAGTRNPLIMLDEVDKLGADFRGDPSSALLEVLDPEQNNQFVDHYLAVAFDLSRVMFIVTANILDTIPPALRDRLEIIRLPGYSVAEKVEIARRHLIPNQISEHGLKKQDLTFTKDAVRRIATEYTSEAGVRNLEREIGAVCRKVAVEISKSGRRRKVKVAPKTLPDFLGSQKVFSQTAERTSLPGVSVGLAWTAAGGEILFIEATRMPGKGALTLTGQLGDVMRESVMTAHSLIRSHAEELGLGDVDFSKEDVHVHVPAGAVPKDGPSAGTAVYTALVSLYLGVPARSDTAMTGEITLRGKVLPIGGVKEKVLAAKRAGIKRVILPELNSSDLEEVSPEHREGVEIHFAKTVDDVAGYIFGPGTLKRRRGRARSGKSARTRK